MAPFFFFGLLRLLSQGSDYSFMIGLIVQPLARALTLASPIHTISQTFSRPVTIAFLLICATGFILLFVKKKLRDADKAVFLTGAVYFGVEFDAVPAPHDGVKNVCAVRRITVGAVAANYVEPVHAA